MKRIEWIVILLLIVIGLSCLTVSSTTLMGNDSIRIYMGNLMQICMWIGLPAILVALIYLIVKRRNRS